MITKTKSGNISIHNNSQQLTVAFAGDMGTQYNSGLVSASAVVWLDVGDQVYLRPSGS